MTTSEWPEREAVRVTSSGHKRTYQQMASRCEVCQSFYYDDDASAERHEFHAQWVKEVEARNGYAPPGFDATTAGAMRQLHNEAVEEVRREIEAESEADDRADAKARSREDLYS